ncbi:DNA-3-methyladenine glycosylase I [Salinimonas marina]|uniref:DNA-3-methyladenine glycosylase I n=1 Tax=Salinimonas marina TaxID=2785918 RepID=A0A7S9DXC5_9ALTE|nr:DNA-3-methyladenine glycosylase I [Salinimonas marina]QPG05684.1 DNA-3-methyladenine glycosylase I [Salinimonas marina]
MKEQPIRCAWVTADPIYRQYHDTVWGRPETDSQMLFKKLCLDGQQAGLSWLTILKKQANYEAAFYNFEPGRIIQMTDKDIEQQMLNTGIIRNRLKIKSIIKNAHGYLKIEEQQPFNEFIWQFTQGKTLINHWSSAREVPVSSAESKAMAKALKSYGFTFVGETICYAFMQATGMVMDHEAGCHCYTAACREALA